MHVPPVRGSGSTPQDNNIFRNQIVRELNAWGGITLVETTRGAEYFINGTLTSPTPHSYSIRLILTDRNSVALSDQTLHYQTMEEAFEYIPTLVFNIIFEAFADRVSGDESLSGIELLPNLQSQPRTDQDRIIIVQGVMPDDKIPDGTWQNYAWYLGGSLFWTPRFYSSEEKVSGNFANIGMSFYAEHCFIYISHYKWRFLLPFSISSGLDFAPDWIIATDRIGDQYRNMILQFPLLFNYSFKPDFNSIHKPYLGILFNIPLFPYTTVPVCSMQTGYQYSRKIGPGIGFADANFTFDFGKSGLDKHNDKDTRLYRRYMLYFGLGYKFGIGKSYN